jgi:Phage tail assembly chaperone protein, TAC
MPVNGSDRRHEFALENGNKFYIRRFDAFLALRVLGEVQKKFLVAFTSLMEANDKTIGQEAQERNLFKAIDNISKSLDGDSLIALVKQVLNPEFVSVSIGGEPPEKLDEGMLNRSIDSVYDVVAIVFEVLKVNYNELFTRGRTLIGQEQSPMASL